MLKRLITILAFSLGSMLLFMMVMGPAGRGGTSDNGTYLSVIALVLSVPFVSLFLLKRLGLRVLGARGGRAAWLYALVVSMILAALLFLLPSAAYGLLQTFNP
jgi:hypothetical protein